jgi:hypothetical protein
VISALTYALMFRVASWALDPSKGRSPVLSGGSVVLGSNGHVFMIMAGVAALVGTWGGWVAWRRTRLRRSDTVTPLADDDTRELVTI